MISSISKVRLIPTTDKTEWISFVGEVSVTASYANKISVSSSFSNDFMWESCWGSSFVGTICNMQ